MTLSPSIARFVSIFNAFNALNVRTAVIYVQKYPGKPSVDAGIKDLDFEVLSNGVVTQIGKSTANGRIDVRVLPGANTVLKVMGSEFNVTVTNDAFAAVNTHTGRKERLRYLGYQIGRHGANGNGVDNDATPRFEYERSVLDFQADHSKTTDADPTTIDADLQADAGA